MNKLSTNLRSVLSGLAVCGLYRKRIALYLGFAGMMLALTLITSEVMSPGTYALCIGTSFCLWKGWSLWVGKQLWRQTLTFDLATGECQAQVRLTSRKGIKRIVLVFEDGVGFYNGTIYLRVNSENLPLLQLPKRPERSWTGGGNLDVIRSNAELVFRFRKPLLAQELDIHFALKPNVSDERMIAKLKSRMVADPTRCTVEAILKG